MKKTLVIFCLFGSGLSSLVYQTTWFREFRYIFGASTAATAAVMAVFMGGLGWGSLVLGKRADRSANPLALYGRLELLITLFAALSPALILWARSFYFAVGGSSNLGPVISILVRLLIGSFVLFVPAFLMGGTLPAVITAFSTQKNANRTEVALSYGANAFGALVGVGFATFYLLEHFGNRGTLWLGCLLNAGIALGALALSNQTSEPTPTEEKTAEVPEDALVSNRLSSAPVLYGAAAVTGFGFFLMELVWYRMLAPILGGSTFTFGIILAVALGGIALGSLGAAAILSRWRATPSLFAWSCALEALCLAVPFALGDRIAIWTMLSQPIGQLSFGTRVAGWLVTTAVVVLPAAVVAGAQFPMLIALLGRGRTALGTQTGRAYAWNTFGAVAGSLAGGFGLLPLLSAPGAWRLVVVVMFLLSLVFLGITWKNAYRSWRHLASGGVALAALFLLGARGPSAVWRHNPIGAGRAKLEDISQNDCEKMARECRSSVVWETDGKESSIALTGDNGYAFLVNGKCDGNSVGDAGTQVMLGLLGALVHGDPHSACVIGMGTGSTAGWLAQIPDLSRVDVVELEPAIERVAQKCAPVNHHVLANPKVHVIFNDAREQLLTTRAHYDLIASEPSNPYRAGVASLFTREFYQAVDHRLNPGGVFVQWIQAYEIDGGSISTICATLASIFPSVELWELESGDMVFVANRETRHYDLDQWRERIKESPFREALSLVWNVNTIEGVFNRYIANGFLCRAVLAAGNVIATDDHNSLEFAIARSVGRDLGFRVEVLRDIARTNQWHRPRCLGEPLDEMLIMDARATEFAQQHVPIRDFGPGIPAAVVARARAKDAFANGEMEKAAELWHGQSQLPADPYELSLVAMTYASAGNEKALPFIEQLRAWRPLDAELIEVHYLWHHRRFEEAIPRMQQLLVNARTAPWLDARLLGMSLNLIKATHFPPRHRDYLIALYQSIESPFAVHLDEVMRLRTLLYLAGQLDQNGYSGYTRYALEALEPNSPWEEDQLQIRADCYTQLRLPLAAQATRDLQLFRQRLPVSFDYISRQGTLKVSARGHAKSEE